jgi:hypothetical protein
MKELIFGKKYGVSAGFKIANAFKLLFGGKYKKEFEIAYGQYRALDNDYNAARAAAASAKDKITGQSGCRRVVYDRYEPPLEEYILNGDGGFVHPVMTFEVEYCSKFRSDFGEGRCLSDSCPYIVMNREYGDALAKLREAKAVRDNFWENRKARL